MKPSTNPITERVRQFFQIPFAIRLAWTLWCLLLVIVVVRVAVTSQTSQTVVPIYLTAGERWLAGEAIYKMDYYEDAFRNPPIIAVGFAGLSLLPAKLVGILIRVLSAGLMLFGMHRFRQSYLPHWTRSQAGWWYCLAALLALPSVNNGQLNILLAATALLGLAALGQGRITLAAVWLSLGVWVKVYPIAVPMLAILILPWRHGLGVAGRGLVLLALGAGLPFLFQSGECVQEYYKTYFSELGRDDRTHALPPRVPRDWTTLARMILDTPPERDTATLVSLGVAVLCAGVLIWRRSAGESLASLMLRLLILATGWMTAFGPATETVSYNLLAAAAPLLLFVGPTWSRLLAGLAVVLLMATILRGTFPNDHAFTILGPQALATMVLMLLTAQLKNPTSL
ncbi:MAG: glycosyltransferase 87 family protein [Fimbriiglobus sp.]